MTEDTTKVIGVSCTIVRNAGTPKYSVSTHYLLTLNHGQKLAGPVSMKSKNYCLYKLQSVLFKIIYILST